jgi:gluconokinase
MTLNTQPIDMVRACMEAVAYRFATVFDVLKPRIPAKRGMIGSGAGLVHSPVWLQIMADVVGEPMTVSAVPEASSRGAALLALEALGAIRDVTDLAAPLGDVYAPDSRRHAIYRDAMQRQERLYRSLIPPPSDHARQ